MTDQELKDLVASLAVSQAETNEEIKAIQIRQAKTNEEISEQIKALQASQEKTDRQIEKTDRQIKQTNKQLGELGNRWGGYTEGLVYPSVKQVLQKTFQMEFVQQRATSNKKGHNLEIDILGFANSTSNRVFVVEVKSRAKDEDIDQLLNTLAEFPQAFPHHAGKELYGMLAAVDIPLNIRQRAVKLGLYVMRASAESFKLEVPAKFQPKNYGIRRSG